MPKAIIQSAIKENVGVYVFKVKNNNTPFGIIYNKGDICLDNSTDELWQLLERARPYMTLSTVNKRPFSFGDSVSGSTSTIKVLVSLNPPDETLVIHNKNLFAISAVVEDDSGYLQSIMIKNDPNLNSVSLYSPRQLLDVNVYISF
jgi:hypothetical protein